MNNLFNLVKQHMDLIVVLLLVAISFFAFLYFFQDGQNLLYGDAQSRLNISRKMVDNLTPGLAQLGNVWLPLPQLLMLPFIWNGYLWHSGIAGAIMSMTAYIIGGIYLFKSAKILSGSFWASLGATSIYALNINVLYFQTTAMSETIFISALIIAIYNFIVWIKDDKKIMNLFFAGAAVSATTLIRYEGLAIMLASVPMVAFYLYIRTKSYKKTEGKTIMYTLMAIFGFLLWTLYLTAVFGDPLYWKNFYVAKHALETDVGQKIGYTFNLNFWEASWKYFTAVVWMNGLIPTILAVTALPLVIYQSINKKTFYFLPVLLSLSIFLFMILTLQRNTPIGQPALTIENILSPDTSSSSEFNIRYGLFMLPLISLLSVYLFKIKFILLKILLIGLLGIQFYSYFKPTYTIIFQIPINIADSIGPGGERSKKYVEWLRGNYDNGLIMISALKHDPQMLQLGYNYKTYIHEGTGKYWKESTKNPQRYAKWVVLDYNNNEDQVTKYLKDSPALERHYNLAYQNKGLRIYKIKTKPETEIQ